MIKNLKLQESLNKRKESVNTTPEWMRRELTFDLRSYISRYRCACPKSMSLGYCLVQFAFNLNVIRSNLHDELEIHLQAKL